MRSSGTPPSRFSRSARVRIGDVVVALAICSPSPSPPPPPPPPRPPKHPVDPLTAPHRAAQPAAVPIIRHVPPQDVALFQPPKDRLARPARPPAPYEVRLARRDSQPQLAQRLL